MGDTGRYPFFIETSPQVFNCLKRLENMGAPYSEALVWHAFTEQKKLGLSWYSGITAMKNFLEESEGRPKNLSPIQI